MTRPIFMSEKDDWETPQYLFDKLNSWYHFTLDPCCTHENAKCLKHYTTIEDGLSQSWKGETVFMNPPFGRELNKWVKKAYEETKDRANMASVVAILPARTDTVWWHEYVKTCEYIVFVRGRVHYEVKGVAQGNSTFATVIVRWSSFKDTEQLYPYVFWKDFKK